MNKSPTDEKDIKNVTTYGLISGIYFNQILKTIISIASLDTRDDMILDFGCGHGRLKKMLNSDKIINYDIVPELSEIDDWRSVDFGVVVVNEVFYSFSADELDAFLLQLKDSNPDVELVVGLSRQSMLNMIGKHLLGHSDAHEGTLLKPAEEIACIKRHMDIVKHRSVFSLMDIYVFRFRQLDEER